MDEDDLEDAILFEIAIVGNAVKVSAIDQATNTEVSIIGPPNMSPYTLKLHAARKLFRKLRMMQGIDDEAAPAKRRKRGVWA
jgi:hypothetical protein